jgi:ATP-dependent Clp protease ATP-binding subunit ClpC
MGFGMTDDKCKYDKMKTQIEESVKRVFSPEFLNRIDDLITFRQLEKSDIFKIIDISTKLLLGRIASLGIEFEFSNEAKEFLATKGYDPVYGARPLRRAVQKYIEDPISEEILRGVFKDGSKIRVNYKEGEDLLTFSDTSKDENNHPSENIKEETLEK